MENTPAKSAPAAAAKKPRYKNSPYVARNDTRRLARAAAFKLIYAYCVAKEKDESYADFFTGEDANLSGDGLAYAEKLYNGVTENIDELTALIAPRLNGFNVGKVFKVDLAVMLLACYELRYCPDVPYKAAVNEALEIVKAFSTDKSAGFVNGVLAAVVRAREKGGNVENASGGNSANSNGGGAAGDD